MADEHCYSVQHADKGGNEATPDLFKPFDAIISQFMTEQGIPGLGVAVSCHGNVLYTQGYGTAGVNRRVTSHSTFRIASISKPLTAMAVMRLVELGHLSLDNKVFGPKGILCEFRPAPKGDKRVLQITVEHLLQHSAGWDRDLAGDPVFFNLDAINPRGGSVSPVSDAFNIKLIKYMMGKKLQFSPGKRHAYSNLGYLVLGLVIERVTGQQYQDYMREMFSHIGLTRLRVGATRRVLADLHEVEYFNNREPPLQKSIFPDEGLVMPQYGSYSMENTGAYGGWVTSPSCLLHILHALQDLKTGTTLPISKSQVTSTGACLSESLACSTCASHEDYINYSSCGSVENDLSPNEIHCSLDENYFSDFEGYSPLFDPDCDMCCVEREVIIDSSFSNELKKEHKTNLMCGTTQCLTFTPFGVPLMKDGKINCQDYILHKSCRSTPLLMPESVCLMLERPGYEEGKQWYGLGLDVQDSGASFGHTGAMEGSCGTMMCHKSGFSWAVLMNAWSRDMDLDGLMKYALSTVVGYPLYHQVESGVSLYEVTSADKAERVMLMVPHCEVAQKVSDAQLLGYNVSYISSCQDNLKIYFNIIFRKCERNCHTHFDISSRDILSVFNSETRRNYHPEFLNAYVLDGKILDCIIFNENVDTRYKICQPLSAKAYLDQVKDIKGRETVMVQSVTSITNELYVSALISETDVDTVSWLQISAEEFLVEQKKQLKKGRDLSYVQFYSLGEDPYVSAVWRRKPHVSDRLQRYGASKFGLLQELRESAAANLRLEALSSYVSEGVVNFAAVWNPSSKSRD